MALTTTQMDASPRAKTVIMTAYRIMSNYMTLQVRFTICESLEQLENYKRQKLSLPSMVKHMNTTHLLPLTEIQDVVSQAILDHISWYLQTSGSLASTSVLNVFILAFERLH